MSPPVSSLPTELRSKFGQVPDAPCAGGASLNLVDGALFS